MQWTEDLVEQLRVLWGDGLSAGEIAKRLNKSRNAVIGKAHRLGLASRPSPIKTKISKEPKSSQSTSNISNKRKKTSDYRHAPTNVLSLQDRTCQWPIGDPREDTFKFCGKKALAGKPYCFDHSCVAYQNFAHEERKRKRAAS